MSVVRGGAIRRWSVMAAVLAALCVLPALLAWWPAAAVRMEPARLRELILASAATPYQGYVDSQGAIGLPPLPQLGEVNGLFGGATSTRVWYASARSWRVAVVDPGGEHDIYRTASGTYVWDFRRNLITEVIGELPVRLPWAADVVPPALARRLLGGAVGDPVTALASRRIAGVPAVGLRLSPADPDATVRRVDIWADPGTGLPLAVEIGGRGPGPPVFTSRFLEVSHRRPDARVVTPLAASSAQFASTSQADVAAAINTAAPVPLPATLAGRQRVASVRGVAGVAAYGTGMSQFVVVPLVSRLGAQSLDALRDAGAEPVTVPGGGQGYQARATILTTLVVRTGGRQGRRTYLLAGMVTPELLNRAASSLATGVR